MTKKKLTQQEIEKHDLVLAIMMLMSPYTAPKLSAEEKAQYIETIRKYRDIYPKDVAETKRNCGIMLHNRQAIPLESYEELGEEN